MSFSKLFEPGQIGGMRLKNRIIMPAMATNFASATGEVTQQMIDYYTARAKGGVGLVIVENTTVEYPQGRNGATQLRGDQDRFIPGLNRLAGAVHDNGAKVALQINHAGGITDERKTEGIKPVAPSPVASGRLGIVPRELISGEIEEIIDKYADAALRAKRAGFDAIEVHGAHGYLIAQFLSPYTNKRTDDYGGDLGHRAKFALEVIERVRDKVGSDFPIIFRLSGDEFIEEGRTLEESKALVPLLERAGIDALHVTAAAAKNPSKQLEPMSYPQGWRAYLAEEIKKEVSIPVITVGVIREPEIAERILEEGKADFIAVGRGLIADPEWANKAAQGREKEIRKCISCNICAKSRVFDDVPIRCSVNPFVGREGELAKIKPAALPKKVAVVGGGPAGMEAARMAAFRGHEVVLYEKEQELGGQLILASRPPHKDKIKWLIEYLIDGLAEKVEVKLGAEVKAELIDRINPDAVILATGAEPFTPSLPGIHGKNVVTAHDVLRGHPVIKGAEVTVAGGGMVGCETAEFLAESDNSVTIIEMLDEIAIDCEPITREELIASLKEYGVEMITQTRLLKVLDHGVVVDQGGRKGRIINGDWVVLALGTQPQSSLVKELKGRAYEVYTVGDCREPRGMQVAIYEGSLIASQIGADRDDFTI